MSDDYLQEDWRPGIGPGGWHDMDMLALGPQFSTATSSCPNKLTPDEQIRKMLEGNNNQQAGMRSSAEDLSGFRFGDTPAAPRPAAGGGASLNVADLLKG